MANQTRIGWRSYVSPLSSLLTSIYGVWNAETTTTTLATSVYSSWNGEIKYTSLDNGVVSVYNAENNANDSKGTNHATLVNGATFSASGKVGSSFYCDGIDDYVQFPNNSLNLTGDFSISMWVQVNYISTWSNYIYPIHNLTADASGNYYGYRLYLNGNSYVFDIGNGTATLDRILFNCGSDPQSQIAPSIGDNWKHIVITRKSGQVTKMYIGGNPITAEPTSPASNTNLKGQNTSTLDPAYLTTHTPYLGKWSNAVTKVDGLTFWNRVLTYTEISKLYNYDMSTSYYANGTTYYYKGNGLQYSFSLQSFSSTEDAVSTNNGTIVGGVTYTTGLVGNAFQFNGSTGYITYPNDTFKLTGNFSISVWVKLNAIGSTQTILSAGTSTSNGFRTYVGSNNKIYFEYSNAGIGNYFTGATTLVANTWYNIALVNTGSVYKIYINGTLDATNVSSPVPATYQTITWAADGTNSAILGRYISSVYFLNGSIDMLTSWTKALTDNEITQLYNMGGGIQYPFTTQTIKTPYSVYNGDDLVDPIGAKNATINGSVTYTTGKIGNAYNFNGSSSLNLPVGSLNFSGSFSFSMWLNFNGTPGNYATILSNCLMGSYKGFIFGNNGGGLYFQLGNGTSTWIQLSGPAVSNFVNTWGLVTLVWEQGVGAKIYMNGVLYSSVANTTTPNFTSITANPVVGVGNGGSGWPALNGKIDGLTFWNSALTAPEILALFNDGAGMEYPYSSTIPAKLPSYGDAVGTNHGTSPSGSAPAFTTGKIGKAFGFDGVNDYIILPNNSLPLSKMSLSSKGSVVGQYNTYTTPTIGSTTFDSAQDVMGVDYSISTWVYLTDVTSSQYVIASYDASGTGYQYGWGIYVGSGKIAQYENFGSSNNNVQATITANTWNHVVFVRKAPLKNGTDNGTIKVYINGTLIATTSPTTNNSIRLLQFPSLTTIGCQRWGAGNANYFLKNGSKIDALSVWDKQLTATEVTDLYNSGNGKQYPSY